LREFSEDNRSLRETLAEDQKEKVGKADYDCELRINCHDSVMR